jgi:hypothetical protein
MALPQTRDTIRQNVSNMIDTFWNDDPVSHQRNMDEYRAEKTRKCKIRMMRSFRSKQKEQFFVSEI